MGKKRHVPAFKGLPSAGDIYRQRTQEAEIRADPQSGFVKVAITLELKDG